MCPIRHPKTVARWLTRQIFQLLGLHAYPQCKRFSIANGSNEPTNHASANNALQITTPITIFLVIGFLLETKIVSQINANASRTVSRAALSAGTTLAAAAPTNTVSNHSPMPSGETVRCRV